MPWKPSFEGEVPTLGFLMIDWYTEYLAHPDSEGYEPFELYREQEEFILDWYRLDPLTGNRVYTRGVLQRPRGWGKSPIVGAIAIGEALGPVRFDGWDANGQPVGKPWKTERKPLIHIAACSDAQTSNTWGPMMNMVMPDAPVHTEYMIVPYDSYMDLGWGRIERVTASARTIKGAPCVFAALDQTEEWVPANGGPNLANVIRSNVGKMRGTSLETPNAYMPGENSVAENSANWWKLIQQGLAKEESLYYSHREAPGETDIGEHDSLLEGLRVAYGDSSADPRGCVLHDPPCAPGHSDLERHISTIWDPEMDPQMARSDYLNQIQSASDAWLKATDVQQCVKLWTDIGDGEAITLGFDGSRGRVRGNADATALIGCRVSDGALFEIKIWQAAANDKDWLPPMFDVDLYLKMAFERWKVVGFYADPSGYTEQIATWTNRYGRKLRVKASQENPIAAWPRGKDTRVEEYLRRLRQAITNHEIPIDGQPRFVEHLLNARTRSTRTGYRIYKAYPESPNKIDGAYAAVMAYKARVDAMSKGIGNTPATDRPIRTGRMVSR